MATTKTLADGLIAFHAAVKTIDKDATSFHGKFASLPHVLGFIKKPLGDAGLAVIQQCTHIGGVPALDTTLVHVGGESYSSITPLVISSGKNAVQEWGKAVTYQRRYALLSILNMAIGIEDNDGDDDTTEPAPVATPKPRAKAAPAVPATATPTNPDAPLTDADKSGLITAIKTLDASGLEGFVGAFKAKFGISGKVSDAIQTAAHQDFIEAYLTSNK